MCARATFGESVFLNVLSTDPCPEAEQWEDAAVARLNADALIENGALTILVRTEPSFTICPVKELKLDSEPANASFSFACSLMNSSTGNVLQTRSSSFATTAIRN